MEDRIYLAVNDGIADVRLARPTKLNALDPAMFEAIAEAGEGAKPLRRVVGADTYTPLAGAAFLVLPGDEDIVAAAAELA